MSATNATTYYELPVFIATDKPAWLTDWNGAMTAIDTAIKEALTAGENAQTTANTATTSIATINDSLTTINTSLTTLTSTVTGLVGSVNTINSLIGNGEPTTSDKTLIGAINEIYGMITGGGGGNEIQAQNVVYDNTTSGLTADDVQEALDEVVSMIQGGGSDYDLDLTAFAGSATPTASAGAGGSIFSPSEAGYGLNADKSIATVYGGINVVGFSLAQGDNVLASMSISDLPTLASAKEFVLGSVLVTSQNTGAVETFAVSKLKFNTDKTVDIILTADNTHTGCSAPISLPQVLYFL